jgi:hypothetical protein
MTPATYNATEPKTFARGYVFGAPIKELGWFTMLVMGLALGVMSFFAATFVGIVFILFWNTAGHHADYTVSYRLMGLPTGLVVGIAALAYLGIFWVKRITRGAASQV